MNLEVIEQLCLTYLQQTENPLASVSKLLQYCQRNDDCRLLQEKELVDFLREHDLFQVVHGPEQEDALDTAVFAQAGIDMGTRVILKTRIPAPNELFAMLNQQIGIMKATLTEALEVAGANGASDSIAQLKIALERAASLESKINQLP